MSQFNQNDIGKLLEKWSQTKEQIANLEKRIEKYKRVANKLMVKEKSNTLNSLVYRLTSRKISKKTISKIDVPVEIWDKYAKTCTYNAYYLHKKT